MAGRNGHRHALAALPGLARAADFGVGKWSRIATYGVKKQQQSDGSWRTFYFDDQSFKQGLENFRRMFAGRGKGMGSDYEHQTLNAPQNGKPAPNLCYFSALAVINQAGKVLGMVDLRGDAPPIDPAAERARIAALNPAADSDPAGTWVLCAEITPLGEQLIPNYSQLSPLFNDADTDEQAREVGLAWQNVSFVNLAFQGGTSFQFQKGRMGASMPTQGGRFQMNPEMQEKLAKFGFEPAKPESAEMAYGAYMEKTDDGPSERSKMAEAFRQMGADKGCMGKLAKFGYDPAKPESAEMAYGAYMEQTEDGPMDRAQVAAAYRKMGKGKMGMVEGQSDGAGQMPAGAPGSEPPVVAAPGSLGDKDMAQMSKLIAPILTPLKERVEVAERASAAAMSKLRDQEAADRRSRLAAFKREMLEGDGARFLPEQDKQLDIIIESVGGDVEKARQVCEIMPPVAAFQRWTRGGNPVGVKVVPPPALAGLSRTQKGNAFNKAVQELRTKKPELTFAEAQQQVASENPDLYEGAL